jgi:hypothetical protein
MSAAMADVVRRAREEEENLSLSTVVLPYLWRLLGVLAVAAAAGAWLARRVGIAHWWSAASMATAAALLVLGLSWGVVSAAWLPLAAPLIAGGAPAAIWTLGRHRSVARAARVVAAWAVASLPAVLLSRSWF